MNARISKPHLGFSLIELVIVIAIMGIMLAIALPKFADAGSGRRLSASVNTLLADIEMVKLRARASSKMHVIKFYPDEEMYIIVEGTEIKKEAVILSRDFKQDPYSLGISRTNLDADETATITVYGDVSPQFRLWFEDDGIEVRVIVNGISDVGATLTDTIVDVRVDLGLELSK
jgi:prepilin-type N-terminal cleavage/methylation domain-containing protein